MRIFLTLTLALVTLGLLAGDSRASPVQAKTVVVNQALPFHATHFTPSRVIVLNSSASLYAPSFAPSFAPYAADPCGGAAANLGSYGLAARGTYLDDPILAARLARERFLRERAFFRGNFFGLRLRF